jgi:hypothetical protein
MMKTVHSEFAFALVAACMVGLPARGWAQDSPVPSHAQAAHEQAAQAQAAHAQAAQAKAATSAEELATFAHMKQGTVESTYENGKLTVLARNARLIDVLHSACDLIGAELNAPEDADQSVLRNVGPAAPRVVLDSLLRNSGFGYAISASTSDPKLVASLSVFAKDKGKDADAQSMVRQMADLVAQARTELSTTYATDAVADSGQANESGAGNDDNGGGVDLGATFDAMAKAMTDPNLVAQLETQLKSSGQGGADGNSDTPPQPAPAPSGVQHRHRR